jgi:hypothetical protein
MLLQDELANHAREFFALRGGEVFVNLADYSSNGYAFANRHIP